MKSTIKLLITVLTLGLVASSPLLNAQPPAGGGQGAKGGRGGRGGGLTVEAVETAVGKLTDEQKTKITALIAKSTEARQALRGGGGDQQANISKMQELNTTLRKDIRALLTDEQKAKFPETAPAGAGGGRRGGKKGN